MLPLPTLQTFDAFLADQELNLEAVIVGGTALSLLGVIERQTQDVDVLAPRLPDAIIAAARAFASEQRRAGHDLADGWFNNGPVQLDEVVSWLQSQDTHPHWPEHVIPTMDHLRRRLGHVV